MSNKRKIADPKPRRPREEPLFPALSMLNDFIALADHLLTFSPNQKRSQLKSFPGSCKIKILSGKMRFENDPQGISCERERDYAVGSIAMIAVETRVSSSPWKGNGALKKGLLGVDSRDDWTVAFFFPCKFGSHGFNLLCYDIKPIKFAQKNILTKKKNKKIKTKI